MTRTRDILKEPVNGGATCESLGPLEQTAPCNEDPCRKFKIVMKNSF